MKKINIRFEKDDKLDSIDIVIRASEENDQVRSIINKLSSNETGTFIPLDSNDRNCYVDENDIIYLSVNGKQINIYTENGVYHIKQTLQSMEERLGRSFQRVSRYDLINLKMVRRYDLTIGGTIRIEFINGAETWASRRYIPLIKKRLSEECDL